MISEVKKAAILGKVAVMLETDPDAEAKLDTVLAHGKLLYSTTDVANLTGWTEGYIRRLCKQGKLPYITGNPHKFLLQPLRAALEQMQSPIGINRTPRRRTTCKAARSTTKQHSAT